MLSPTPNSPFRLLPQAQRLPSFFKARQCASPASTSTQSVSVPVWLKRSTKDVSLFPLPNCPCLARPHSQMVPSERKAAEKRPPAATFTHFFWANSRVGTQTDIKAIKMNDLQIAFIIFAFMKLIVHYKSINSF